MSALQVLVPECTEGIMFDCLYCDASVSEEDLPMFLSLLKPGGKMLVMLDEEAVLVTRGGEDAHDFSREVLSENKRGSQVDALTLEAPSKLHVTYL
jgi:protein-L-isoaspartate O-methyltransferase